jgi:hypothetical protein
VLARAIRAERAAARPHRPAAGALATR